MLGPEVRNQPGAVPLGTPMALGHQPRMVRSRPVMPLLSRTLLIVGGREAEPLLLRMCGVLTRSHPRRVCLSVHSLLTCSKSKSWRWSHTQRIKRVGGITKSMCLLLNHVLCTNCFLNMLLSIQAFCFTFSGGLSESIPAEDYFEEM